MKIPPSALKVHGKEIELTDQFRHALDVMENTSKHVFVTGKAGTGKSTLLDLFRICTKKKVAVLAPTGVAALNVQGQTIHSFFRFMPDITPDAVEKYRGDDAEIYRAIDTIVIDEISMVRADLLDCVDRFMSLNGKEKNKKFGGLQMIFIGDLYQLPPVVTGREREIFRTLYKSQYFFDSRAFGGLEMEFIELEKVFRQKDGLFVRLLNSIRNNSVRPEELSLLNSQLDPFFETKSDDFWIQLTPTNDLASATNERELSKLSAPLFVFRGKIRGDFDRQSLPTDMELKVKAGSQIMMVNNDSLNRWVNGSVGRVTGIEKGEKGKSTISVELSDGTKADVQQHKWDVYRLVYDRMTGRLESQEIGSFTQYPLRLAWSVTIHKSQGKTFEKVIIDMGRGAFTHGQTYVALSRCTSLEGLVLRKPIEKKHILMDWKVVKFLTRFQYGLADRKQSVEDRMRMIAKAIEQKAKLEIVYLKPNDEKSRRVIEPKRIGRMEYMGKEYNGVEAFCLKRQDNRIFRVDRILEMKEA